MLRYRCPQCSQLLSAHELRAGKRSVCTRCLTSHVIPAERHHWLNEAGEPLAPPPAEMNQPVAVTEPASADSKPIFAEPTADSKPTFAGPTFAEPSADPKPTFAEPTYAEPSAIDISPLPSAKSMTAGFTAAAEPTAAEPPSGSPGPADPAPADPLPAVAPAVDRDLPEPELGPTKPDWPEAEPALNEAAPTPVSPAYGPTPLAPGSTVVLSPVPRATRRESSPADTPLPRVFHARTQADIAAAITEALTLRMRPPRKPHRDLRPSTALWLVLLTVAVVLVPIALFTGGNPRQYGGWVIGLGIAQLLLGYVWIVWLTGRRASSRGLACAVPPVTIYYLLQQKYARLRPLRFVVTGVLLVAVGLLLPIAAPTTRAWVGVTEKDSDRPTLPAPTGEGTTKLDQIRGLLERKAYDRLIELIRSLARTDEVLSADARDRDELAVELRRLVDHPDTGVKVAALEAYARWGGADARELCLNALSRSEEEKLMALRLLPQWKDTEAAPAIAQAIAALIVRPGLVTNRAIAALEEVGGPAAEAATLGLLTRSDEQAARVLALNILEKVGGERAITVLRGYAATSLDQTIKAKTLDTIEVIRARLGR